MINNVSIKELYFKLNDSVQLVESYLQIPNLAKLFKACRLKPTKYLFKSRNNKIQLYRDWVDEFGNSLSISKKKKIKIIYNDLLLDRNKIITTDLYYGLSIEKVIKISTSFYYYFGQDEDIQDDCGILVLLGIDNFLRAYLYSYGEWRQVSPLLVPLDDLNLLINTNFKIEQLKKINKEINPVPCINAKAWLNCIPPNLEFLEFIKKEDNIISSLFT